MAIRSGNQYELGKGGWGVTLFRNLWVICEERYSCGRSDGRNYLPWRCENGMSKKSILEIDEIKTKKEPKFTKEQLIKSKMYRHQIDIFKDSFGRE